MDHILRSNITRLTYFSLFLTSISCCIRYSSKYLLRLQHCNFNKHKNLDSYWFFTPAVFFFLSDGLKFTNDVYFSETRHVLDFLLNLSVPIILHLASFKWRG